MSVIHSLCCKDCSLRLNAYGLQCEHMQASVNTEVFFLTHIVMQLFALFICHVIDCACRRQKDHFVIKTECVWMYTIHSHSGECTKHIDAPVSKSPSCFDCSVIVTTATLSLS